MKKNMGMLDRAVRVLIALVIIFLYASGHIPGSWAAILLTLSGIFILTNLLSFGPLYLPFGIRSNRVKTKVDSRI